MNENAKTGMFVLVAAAVVTIAALSRPSLTVLPPDDMRGKPLYPDFTDPLIVSSLEIVDYDEGRGEIHPFKVAEVDVKGTSRWSIPSHDDYPADAKDQVALAATGLVGLEVIDMISDNEGDQREYGVIDPDPKSLKVGETGVGKKVIMKDNKGRELLALIVGRETPDRPELRYVRKAGESPIYIVKARTDKLSTRFEDWIERNLLGINSFDIKRLWIRDHSVDELNAALMQRGEAIIEHDNDAEEKWKLTAFQKFQADEATPGAGRWVTVEVSPDDELNAAKLDELKTALNDLKIIDVARKPSGLSADLKAEADFASNAEAVDSLGRKGFYIVELNGRVELFSNEGEIRVIMNDGVEYVLRFGEIAGNESSNRNETAKEGDADKGNGVSRYLFVMAEFDPDMIAKPQLEPIPEAKEADRDAKDADKDEKTADQAADEPASEEKTPADAQNIDSERQQIEKENQRKQDEYERKIADGKKRVEELNARFADWYYVISDNVYQKIHLSHDDLLRKKPKAEDKTTDAAPSADLQRMMQMIPGGK